MHTKCFVDILSIIYLDNRLVRLELWKIVDNQGFYELNVFEM